MSSAALEREIQRYEARTPKSRALQAEAADVLPGGSSRGTAYFAPYPFFAEGGEGHYVYDADGNRYLDFMLNATSLILGHAHPEIVEGIAAQAAKGTAFSTPTVAQVRLARLLCDRIPSMDTVRFTNSGTEGTLMAIRAARALTGRPKIAKFEGGYHGAHEYVAVSVQPPAAKLDPAGPTAIPEYPGQPASIAADVVVLPYNDLAGSERRLRAHAAELACLIMEPVMSSFGYVPGRPGVPARHPEGHRGAGHRPDLRRGPEPPGGAGRRPGALRRDPGPDVPGQDHRGRAARRRLRRPPGHHGAVRPDRGRAPGSPTPAPSTPTR